MAVTLEKLLQMVKHCPTDHELEFLVEGGVWKGRKVVWQAIFDRWTELCGNQQGGGNTQFGNEEFWGAAEKEEPKPPEGEAMRIPGMAEEEWTAF